MRKMRPATGGETESHMWRLGIPIIHYGNEVIDWTGASGQMKGEVTAYSLPTPTASLWSLGPEGFRTLP